MSIFFFSTPFQRAIYCTSLGSTLCPTPASSESRRNLWKFTPIMQTDKGLLFKNPQPICWSLLIYKGLEAPGPVKTHLIQYTPRCFSPLVEIKYPLGDPKESVFTGQAMYHAALKVLYEITYSCTGISHISMANRKGDLVGWRLAEGYNMKKA